MSLDNREKSVMELNRDSLEEATEVLAAAFEDDPFIGYALDRRKSGYPGRVREIFRFNCIARFELGIPLIGTVCSSRITGIACISLPEKQEWPDSLVRAGEDMKSAVGKDLFGRFEEYGRLSKKHTPGAPHHYLAVLGVSPEYQGRGFGRMLLDKIHEIAENHRSSAGVYMETAAMNNVRMYEYFGYERKGSERLDDMVDLWYMFRKNR